jgi:outer membrane protein OmpA-like peptidoglycan-associated protein
VEIFHQTSLGPHFEIESIRYRVDGDPLELEVPAPKASGQPTRLLKAPFLTGIRRVQVDIRFKGSSPVFQYLDAYRFRARAMVTLNVETDHVVELTTELSEANADLTTSWERKPALQLRALPRKAVIELEVQPIESVPESKVTAQTFRPDAWDSAPPSPKVQAALELQLAKELEREARAQLQPSAQAQKGQAQVVDGGVAQPPVAEAGGGTAGAGESGVSAAAIDAGTAASSAPASPSCSTSPIPFAHDSSQLDESARSNLRSLVACLRPLKGLRVQLAGHTDDLGPTSHNDRLAMRRARSVAQFLSTLGLAAAQVEVSAFGEARPLCTEETDACRAQNRRVEVTVSRAPSVRTSSAPRP